MLSQDEFRWPVVFSAGTLVQYEPADDFGSAYFGGPLEQAFSGVPFGVEPLHRIFTFSPAGLPQPIGHNLQGRMSFFFGMRYSGCELAYRIPVLAGVNAQFIQDYGQTIEVTAISPVQSSEAWPYLAYPRLLPYVPLKEKLRAPMQAADFVGKFTWQGLERFSDNELVAVVPAASRLGVSMWGRSGDEEAVQLVFRYSYVTHEISASTQCT